MNGSTQIEIKILSHERWESLQRLLASLNELDRNNFSCRVEIIDNSEKSPLTSQQIELIKKKYDADYFYAGLTNIAAARNVALARCASPYLAFIDDDEVASPNWLAALFAEMERTRSDVVMGRSIPRPVSGKSWLLAADVFQSPAEGYIESTANCLLRMTPLRGARVRFDERFGKCGGSDFDFFTRLRCLSFRFSYAPSAITYEEFNEPRVNFRWVVRRAFRCGGTRGAVLSKYQKSQHAQEMVAAPHQLLGALFSVNGSSLGSRLWRFFFFSGFLFFSLSGKVLSEYEPGLFKLVHFSHARWSFCGTFWLYFRQRTA